MVEFALVLPLLAFVLFAIIQYGFIFAAYVTLRNASAVTARYAILSNPSPSISQIQAVGRSAVTPMLSTNGNLPTVTVLTNQTVGGVSGATSVNIQYHLPLIVPFVVPGKGPGSSLTLNATTIMR